jgi:GT2 family glycosyltransferase
VWSQTFGGWELCPCPAGTAAVAAEAVATARGEFVALLGEGDRLDRQALALVDKAIRSNPEADLVYTDEGVIGASGRRSDALFKPDWSPERLRAEPYVGRLCFLRRSLVEEVGGLDVALGAAAEWDLALKVSERARAIVHVPRLLYHRHAIGRAGDGDGDCDASVGAVQAHCERIGLPAQVEADPARPGGCRLRPALSEQPKVSIVIPTRGQRRAIRGTDEVLVLHCVRSILATSTYEDYELVCVADAATEPAVLDEVRRIGGERLRIVVYEAPFNFSTKINLGAAHSEGEHLLLLNDDMEVVSPDWIERLVMYSGHTGIAAVGAQLRWEDERVQHAGVVLEHGLPGHVYRGAGGELDGYARNVLVTQNYLAVTGACLMTPRDVFEAVGGLSEKLPVNYNDIDYCLKLHSRGLRVVYDADTVLYHFESSSRDTKVDDWEKAMLRERWQAVGRDPYSNPNLRYGEPRGGLLRRASRVARARLLPDR